MNPQPPSPDALIKKADKACSSAQALLELGDTDGAANRAYYAMFSAARAALLASGAVTASEGVERTHGGLIGAFGRHLVKDGPLPKEMGRFLNRAHESRLIADYNDAPVEVADAQELVEQASIFVEAMRTVFMPDDSDEDRPTP